MLGGVNLAFWPMSVRSRNGIVFIRREFKNDQVCTRPHSAPTWPA